MALKLADGKVRWQAQGKNAFSASPCVAGGALYIGDEGGYFHAVNASNGHTRWTFKAEGKILSSATVAPGVVLFGSYDNHLYCLNVKTGKLKWKSTFGMPVHCTPCVTGRRVVIAGCDGIVRVLDLAAGKQRAACTIPDTNFAASAAGAADRVFVGALNGLRLCVRLADGKALWRSQEQAPGAAVFASPALAASAVIYGSRSRNVYALDPATGRQRWAFTTRGDVDSSPVVAGGMVWFGDDSGQLYGLSLATGKQAWRFRAGGAIKASPAVSQGRLVIGVSDGALYCFAR